MGNLIVRTFDLRDESSVINLWRSAFPNDPSWNEPKLVIQRKLAAQPELFLVGEVAGTVVATVLAGYDGVRGWVYHLAVAKEQQRNGYGQAMMRAAEERLCVLSCPKINLQVRSTNIEVVKFYKAIGYQIQDRVDFGKRLEDEL